MCAINSIYSYSYISIEGNLSRGISPITHEKMKILHRGAE